MVETLQEEEVKRGQIIGLKRVLREASKIKRSPWPRRMKAEYAGRCVFCGLPYDQGDEIFWQRGCGAVHAHCHDPRDTNYMMRMREMFQKK